MTFKEAEVDQNVSRICNDEGECHSLDPWYNEGPGDFPAQETFYETWQIPWESSFEDAEILAKERCPAANERLLWVFRWMHPLDVARRVGIEHSTHDSNRMKELADYTWGLVESVSRYGITHPLVLNDDLIEEVPVLEAKLLSRPGNDDSSVADVARSL